MVPSYFISDENISMIAVCDPVSLAQIIFKERKKGYSYEQIKPSNVLTGWRPRQFFSSFCF